MGLSKRFRKNVKPRLPDGVRIYAIGDVHGRADLLQSLLTVIDADLARSAPERAIQVFLGDYVDRGPDSRAVIDLLIERSKSHETVCLKGNHEVFLLEVLKDPARLEEWRRYGGLLTLVSYGINPTMNPTPEQQIELIEGLRQALPREHLSFLQQLRPSFACGDFFFVHAGVKPGVALERQKEEDLLWIREEFLESERRFGKYIVHGHTPVSVPDIRSNRINIDTGAYATGNLTLLTIQGDSLLAI
ncbi:serine/threonine protein phosphatase 1 [Bradyrhizobium sp. GM2.2]|uniref:Serine/threonine protein phosphatase n=1 Tax=Bradyrhizobium canariense TaxID=255045 RepID=A0A1X3HAI6_9BRAD|nr:MULTISPECIES: metallophosphoesterase family protein [Bradyrhizobium]MBM7488379.1 serine/threonine protein phosphatase 1 [Bradyrhizobium canariense]MCK1269288.1 serine/threonine protein phosphatase [Bradyrhizobium sp. 84]MCK1317401.1 serine/threonine protein phosphatase [Bradyrhizobium sp. 23]MCK1325076.1 serine/threonine protein phosphatase [Bradyrhizobium sp. 156]MCK1374994.1 serine/threonine protein phosphatase [Bradyrhizobium sp. 49]